MNIAMIYGDTMVENGIWMDTLWGSRGSRGLLQLGHHGPSLGAVDPAIHDTWYGIKYGMEYQDVIIIWNIPIYIWMRTGGTPMTQETFILMEWNMV